MKPRIGDFAIAVLVVAIALGIWLYPHFSEKGSVAEVYVDGEIRARLSLSEDISLPLSGCTVLVSGGSVRITASSCPDKVCEKTGGISKSGETIVCVPNRVSIKIRGKAETDVIAS